MLYSEIGYFIEPRESSKDTINPRRDFTQIHLHSLKGAIFIYSRMPIEEKKEKKTTSNSFHLEFKRKYLWSLFVHPNFSAVKSYTLYYNLLYPL